MKILNTYLKEELSEKNILYAYVQLYRLEIQFPAPTVTIKYIYQYNEGLRH